MQVRTDGAAQDDTKGPELVRAFVIMYTILIMGSALR